MGLDVNMLIAMGRTLRGIVGGNSVPSIFFPRLIALWQDGRMPWDRLIQTFAFDQINEAAERSESGEVIKAVLLMPGFEPRKGLRRTYRWVTVSTPKTAPAAPSTSFVRPTASPPARSR